MSRRNLIALGALFVILLVAIFVTLFLISSNQDTRSRADTPDTFPTPEEFVPPAIEDEGQAGTSCPDPGAVENVIVDYPSLNGDDANWNEASCSWDANTNAATYNLKVIEVDTGTVIQEESINSGVQKSTFPVTPGNTYRCEVSAQNSCGVAGTAGFDEQVCEIVGGAVSPTATPSPTLTTAPTASPTAVPTVIVPTATPTLPPTGNFGTIATIGVGGILLMLIGGALLFL